MFIPGKKKIRQLLLAAMLLGSVCPGVSYSAVVNSNASVTLGVNSVFTLTIDTVSVSMGDVKPGDWTEVPSAGSYANAVICKSNTGNEWKLNINADGPLAFGAYTIPLSNFKWLATYAGNQGSPYQNVSSGLNYDPAAGFRSFSGGPFLVYTSGKSSAWNDNNSLPNGTTVQFSYGLQAPDDLPAGEYSTTVTYTMYE